MTVLCARPRCSTEGEPESENHCMSSTPHSSDGSGFIIGMDPQAAWSAFYDDGQARWRFVFDVGRDPKKVYLCARPLQGGVLVDAADEPTRARVNVSIGRV